MAQRPRQDRMPPTERVTALLNGQPVDRAPLFPFILGFCARNVGYPIATIYKDAEKSFRAQVWTQEQYGYDGYPQYGYASYGTFEFGGEIKLPDSEWEQAPSHSRYPVQSVEDVERLELPQVETAGMIPVAMEFSQLQKKSGLPITFTVGGVFTIAGNICQVDKLCRWMIKKPGIAHMILRLAADHILDIAQYWAQSFGGERVIASIWEPLAANQIISPNQFQDFVLPYQREVNEKILATGIKHILCHICGDHNLNLPYWVQIPMGDPGIVSLGREVDLTTAIEYFGDSCIIAGNIEPQVIQSGTPQQVYELCKQAIKKGKKAPRGYILMAGCEVPPMAPPYNFYMMKKAIDDFGWYD